MKTFFAGLIFLALLLGSCATVEHTDETPPIPATDTEPFSLGRELTHASNGTFLMLSELAREDATRTDTEKRAAHVVRIATILAIGSYFYEKMTPEERELADAVALEILKGTKKKEKTKQISDVP